MYPINLQEEVWDKKKIALAAILALGLVALVFFSKDTLIGSLQKENAEKKATNSQSVQGVKTENEDEIELTEESAIEKIDLQQTLQGKLNDLKKNVNDLNVKDIATSSSQMQKVMQDLENLQQMPRNQAKDACYNICKSL